MKSLSPAAKGLAIPLAILAPLAHAQDLGTTPEDIQEIDTLVVTGTSESGPKVESFKTGTALLDIPESLSVFTAEQIEEQGITDIRGIVDYTPGLVSSQGEGHRDAVVFRGIRGTANFFVDGKRDDVQYYRSLYNVEQVEILRGANALFFGRGGAGGVINRVQKKAEIGTDYGKIQGSINTFGGTSAQFDYNRTLSDNAALRLNVFTESLANHRDFFDGERIGVNPTLTYEIFEDTTLTLSYEYSDHERFIDRGIPTGDNGRPVSALSGTTFGDSELNKTTLEAHTFNIGIDHRFSDKWKGSLSAFYGTYDKVYSNYFASDFNEATNEVEIDGYVDRTDRQTLTLAGDLVGEFSTGFIEHKVLLGAEYSRTSSDQDRFNNVFSTNGDDQEFFAADGFRISNGVVTGANGDVLATGTFTDLNDDTEVTVDVHSIFLQDEISIGRKLDLVVGARFDSFNIDVFNAVTNERLTNRDQQVSPRFGIVYKPIEELSIYASYTQTFLPRSGEQFTDINPPDNALDPDTFDSLEVGVKWNIRDNLNFSLAGFRLDASSPQVADSDAGTLDVIDTETFGIEAQIQGQITDQWFITAGYAYLNGEQIDENGGSGLDPREQPENTFSIWSSFDVTEKFGFGVGMVYQDESFADNANTAVLPSYVRFDASAHYNFSDTLRAQLHVENIFDRDYFPNGHTADNITVGAPLNATFMISKSF